MAILLAIAILSPVVLGACSPCFNNVYCYCCVSTISCTQLVNNGFNATHGRVTLNLGRFCDVDNVDFSEVKSKAASVKFVVFENGVCGCSANAGMFAAFAVRGRERCNAGSFLLRTPNLY
jgi:hypothetical protein